MGIYSARDVGTREKMGVCSNEIICSPLPRDRTGGGAFEL